MSTADYVEGRMERPPYAGVQEDAAMFLQRRLWETHEVTVARNVDDGESWRTVARDCQNGVVAAWLIAGAMDRLGMQRAAASVVRDMRAAAHVLWPYAYPHLPRPSLDEHSS